MTSRTGDKKFNTSCTVPPNCMSCKYFRINVKAYGRGLEMCEATGEQLIYRYGELIKSDNCPFEEVKNV